MTDVSAWLSKFESALAQRDEAALRALFHVDGHWRDVLASGWRIRTVSGVDSIVRELPRAEARNFRLDPARTAPRPVKRAGEECVEAIFRFETAQGIGAGVLRLKGEKAWTLLTALEDLKGHEEGVGERRPKGWSYSRDFGGPNWLDLQKKKARFEDAEPAVLVVGGGQAGLS